MFIWHHLQKASKEFFANRWILQDPHVSIATRLKYFDRMMTTVACFAAGHRVEKKGGWTRTCLTWNYAVVGNPPGTNWLDWHEIFTRWNERAGHFAAVPVPNLGRNVCAHYWRFARYAAYSLHTNGLNVYWLAVLLPHNSGHPTNS